MYCLVITGSREYQNMRAVATAIREAHTMARLQGHYLTVYNGKARAGADKLAGDYVKLNTFSGTLKERPFPADWSAGGTLVYPKYDRDAGFKRNRLMVETAVDNYLRKTFAHLLGAAFYVDGVPCNGTNDCHLVLKEYEIPTRAYNQEGVLIDDRPKEN